MQNEYPEEDDEIVKVCLDVDTILPFLRGMDEACVGKKTRERIRQIDVKIKLVRKLEARMTALEEYVNTMADTFVEVLSRLEKMDD